jgi:hypothetical protein
MDPITIALALASQFAPGIVKHFTNSDTAATVAGQVLDIAKTVTGKVSPVEAQAALQADPALALQFARKRDVELAKAGVHNYRANVLVAAALLLVIVCLLIVVWSSNADDFAKATISLILGRALGWVEQLFSFEFGTTRANKTKDDTINKLSGV